MMKRDKSASIVVAPDDKTEARQACHEADLKRLAVAIAEQRRIEDISSIYRANHTVNRKTIAGNPFLKLKILSSK